MTELGKLIYEARVANGLELEDVAKLLRIKQEYIVAIEENNEAAFSSHTYYRGYLKQYLKLFELEKLIICNDHNISTPELAINIPITDSFNPNITITLISLILSILIYNFSDNFLSKTTIHPIALEFANKDSILVNLSNK